MPHKSLKLLLSPTTMVLMPRSCGRPTNASGHKNRLLFDSYSPAGPSCYLIRG